MTDHIDQLDQINQTYSAVWRDQGDDATERWSDLCDRAASMSRPHGQAVARLLLAWAAAYGMQI